MDPRITYGREGGAMLAHDVDPMDLLPAISGDRVVVITSTSEDDTLTYHVALLDPPVAEATRQIDYSIEHLHGEAAETGHGPTLEIALRYALAGYYGLGDLQDHARSLGITVTVPSSAEHLPLEVLLDQRVVEAARGLVSEREAPNPEYDRALIEMVCDLSPGVTMDDRATVAQVLDLRWPVR